MIEKKVIIESLKRVTDADGTSDIVSRNRVHNLAINGSEVKIELVIPDHGRQERFRIEDEAREAVKTVDGVESVMVVTLRSQSPESAKREDEPQKAAEQKATPEDDKEASPFKSQAPIPGVKNIIAVASGKGGVGKSTVCVNLALALAKRGAKVGLLDADVYGPSLKVLLGVDSVPKPGPNKDIQPVQKDGLKLMSLAFLTDPSTPVIWRGPLVSSILKQFLNEVNWGELDYLLIDLPPGTGDAQLTLVQTVPLTSAIIVTTPSELALVDAEKGLRMFVQLNVPVLGVIENMSYFVCPHCGESTDIFDHGGGEKVSRKYSTNFLGEIPLDGVIRRSGDGGRPVIISEENSPVTQAFYKLAETLMARCPVGAK